jgi:hypothetical protein
LRQRRRVVLVVIVGLFWLDLLWLDLEINDLPELRVVFILGIFSFPLSKLAQKL